MSVTLAEVMIQLGRLCEKLDRILALLERHGVVVVPDPGPASPGEGKWPQPWNDGMIVMYGCPSPGGSAMPVYGIRTTTGGSGQSPEAKP